ncbi:MAG: HAD-IA family hydrolase [Acidimicrobiales bacterium]
MLLSCRAVLFDCDGVLVDSAASVRAAWARWAQKLGLDAEEVYRLVHGRRSEDTVALLVPEARRAEEVARIDRLEIEDAPSVRAVKGARDLVASIPEDRWAVVTSGRRELALARLAAAGLPAPRVMVSAEDVVMGKPDPEGYKAAALRMGLATSATVVVEDSVAGAKAARAAGAKAVVGVGDEVGEAGADVVVKDLSWLRWTGTGLEVHQGARSDDGRSPAGHEGPLGRRDLLVAERLAPKEGAAEGQEAPGLER